MAFDENDDPVLHVGEKGGVRAYNSLGKAKGQRRRWVNGTKWGGRGRLYNHFPRSKVFEVVVVAGVLMSTEVDCE